MKSYDVIGYYQCEDDQLTGDAYCLDCAPTPVPEDWAAIFPGTESDSPTHCACCEALIPHSLTHEGSVYAQEAVKARTGRPAVLTLWEVVYGGSHTYIPIDLVPRDQWTPVCAHALA